MRRTWTSRLGLRPDRLLRIPLDWSGRSPNLRTWLIFGVCVLAATITVAWLSRQTLQAERSERHARQQADLENRIRVALWRMDSIAVPLVAIESTRPTLADPSQDGPALAPQLLKGYAQRSADGRWTLRRNALAKTVEPLAEDSELLAHDGWWNALPAPEARSLELRVADAGSVGSDAGSILDPNSNLIVWPSNFAAMTNNTFAGNTSQRVGDRNTLNANQFESQSRSQLKQQVFDVANLGQQAGLPQGFGSQGVPQSANRPQRTTPTPIPNVEYRASGAMLPLWVGDELLLARRVKSEPDKSESIEACWLDWPAWDKVLREQINDLLPGATLQLVKVSNSTDGDRELVALPVRLEPGTLSVAGFDDDSWPAALIVAWVMLALTAAAVGWLLWQTLKLSERRAAFVSAVTHELRTPLTTFRLYTEMLTDGLVQDRDQQQSYFRTLHREANRLMHMVENVLAYARLEKGRPTNRTEELSLGDLLDRCSPRLSQRVSESPLRLELTLSEQVRGTRLTTNALAVEQVLFNLIDNACKYAADATDPRITLEAEATDTEITIRVRDFGPGLSPNARRQLFEPFGKSSAQAAETAPGIGLGLSLARRLARDLGGDLRCDPLDSVGLVFRLTLPASSEPQGASRGLSSSTRG